jgi:lincosamide nucleotidyltransferase A/C/D/E
MTESAVIDLYAAFEAMGAIVWIDGGWAVDALLGEQSRPHGDLDIAVEEKYVTSLRDHLESRGYRDSPRDDTHRWNFALADDAGRTVDFHTFILDAHGDVIDGLKYPTGSLAGWGRIAGRPVRCIEPAHLVQFHTGYPIRPSDRADVAALCRRFGLALPDGYGDDSPT